MALGKSYSCKECKACFIKPHLKVRLTRNKEDSSTLGKAMKSSLLLGPFDDSEF